jgi:transcriptional regulator GlxA family with amidase domain
VIHFRLESADLGAQQLQLFQPEVPAKLQVVRGNHLANAALVRELRREALRSAAHSGAIQDCLLEAFFWRLMRAFEPAALSSEFRRLPRVEEMRESLVRLVDRSSFRSTPVSELARGMNVSVRRLHSICRLCLGRSPARLLLEARIQRAEDLIRYSGLSSKEVSDRLGFANPFHFSRAFRRIRGFPASTLGGTIQSSSVRKAEVPAPREHN